MGKDGGCVKNDLVSGLVGGICGCCSHGIIEFIAVRILLRLNTECIV